MKINKISWNTIKNVTEIIFWLGFGILLISVEKGSLLFLFSGMGILTYSIARVIFGKEKIDSAINKPCEIIGNIIIGLVFIGVIAWIILSINEDTQERLLNPIAWIPIAIVFAGIIIADAINHKEHDY